MKGLKLSGLKSETVYRRNTEFELFDRKVKRFGFEV